MAQLSDARSAIEPATILHPSLQPYKTMNLPLDQGGQSWGWFRPDVTVPFGRAA
ncbi:MAG: hypothetical protein KBA71_02890 [Opitutaceae bacterium]|nr:hypothetical protein [Opitutaceae bacterium]